MIKMVLTFMVICIALNLFIEYFTASTGGARWGLLKRLLYVTIIASVSLFVLTAIYLIF